MIHTAFDHDFAHFVANCEKDRQAIQALGSALLGSDRPLLITSGTGMGSAGHGQPATVLDWHPSGPGLIADLEKMDYSVAHTA